MKDDTDLHLYSQEHWHGEAFVVGTRDGLLALRDAIDDALQGNGRGVASPFAGDGEGYNLHVVVVTGEELSLLPTPYTSVEAADYREEAHERLRELMVQAVLEGRGLE